MIALRGRSVKRDDRDAIKVLYPSRFELNDAADLIDCTTKLQRVLANCGNAPNTERELIQATIRQLLLGLDDDEYAVLDDEIELLVKTKSQLSEPVREMADASIASQASATEGNGSEEQFAGNDPTGQSGATAVSGTIPGIM